MRSLVVTWPSLSAIWSLRAPCSRAQIARSSALSATRRIPHEAGFRVFIVPDMEGMGSAVDSREILAGNEGAAYKDRSSPDYWDHFRSLLTQEVNATIKGARAAGGALLRGQRGPRRQPLRQRAAVGARHRAMLVRGFPKPLMMVTGIDTSFGTLMFIGAHANAGQRASCRTTSPSMPSR